MLTVILISLVVIGLVFILIECIFGTEENWCAIIGALFEVAALIVFVFLLVAVYHVKTAPVLDNNIKLYETENQKIEDTLQEVVENYMHYESSTYKEYKPNVNIEVVVAQIPELKSNELITQQIATLKENKAMLLKLKEKRNNLGKSQYYINFKTEVK